MMRLGILLSSVGVLYFCCSTLATLPPLPLGEDVTHEVSAVDVMIDRLRGHAHTLQSSIEPLMTSPQEKEKLQWLVDAIDANDADEEEEMPCNICKTIIGILIGFSRTTPWLVAKPLIQAICVNMISELRDPEAADIICPGIIDLQGKAVYDILGTDNVTNEKVCENLNACIPPRPSASLLLERKIREEFGFPLDLISQAFGPQQRILHRPRRGGKSRRNDDAIRIVQLADIHIEPDYEVGSATDCGLPVCCQKMYDGQGSAGTWGDYDCNIPERTMYLFLRKARELDPDFIIFSGDTPPHTMWEETFDSQLDCTERLVKAVGETLPDVVVYPNIGNHEMYPTNLYYTETSDTQDMNDEFATLWTPYANFSADQITTMQAGGYYSILARPGLRIISMNTNYWYSFNFYNVLNEDHPDSVGMKRFIEQELQKARENSEKVIMVGHHPISAGDAIVTGARWLVEVMVEYQDIIVLSMGGHTHTDEFRMINAYGSDEPVGVYFIAPSVTTKTLKNPSFRVFHLSPDTYEVQDYDQYQMDLSEAVANGTEPDIKLVYTATEEFGLADMSQSSWQDFLQRMAADRDLLGDYLYHYNTGTVADPLDRCDDMCQVRYLCKFVASSFDVHTECLREHGVIGGTTIGPTDPGDAAPNLHATPLILLLMGIVTWMAM